MPKRIALPKIDEWFDQGQTSLHGHPIRGKVVQIGGEDETYHQRPELSHSQFKLYIDEPSKFEDHIINDVPLEFGPAAVKAMDFGSKAEFVLFYNRLPGDPVMIPQNVLSKRKRRKDWFDEKQIVYDENNPEHHTFAKSGANYKKWAADYKDRWLLRQDEWEKEIQPLLQVREQVRSHELAKSLIYGPGHRHVAIVFICPWTGRELRCQIDVISLFGWIVDFKTCRPDRMTPRGFATQIFDKGYHIQALWYRIAFYSVTGIWLPFTFVVGRNTKPYNVETFGVHPDFYQLADKEIHRNMLALNTSIDTGKFVSPTFGKMVDIEPAFWMKPRGAAAHDSRYETAIQGAAV